MRQKQNKNESTRISTSLIRTPPSMTEIVADFGEHDKTNQLDYEKLVNIDHINHLIHMNKVFFQNLVACYDQLVTK
jgi:hypothetical protein